jgi:hypothetical protein
MGEMGEDGKKTSDGFGHGGVYEDGPYKTQIVRLAAVQKQASRCLPVKKMMKKKKRHGVRVVGQQQISSNSPPKPLLIAVPKAKGKYPVVQFHHGFTLQNNFYSQLIAHLASHGFIVVAPQVNTKLYLLTDFAFFSFLLFSSSQSNLSHLSTTIEAPMVLSMIFFQPLGGRSVGWLSIFEGLRDFACLLAGLGWVGLDFYSAKCIRVLILQNSFQDFAEKSAPPQTQF